jgi:hypothetical protein
MILTVPIEQSQVFLSEDDQILALKYGTLVL